jgi:hypothetical protein
VNDPLLQSCISEHIWQLMNTNPAEFKLRVKDYFAEGYPGWTVTKINYATRTIYLKDDRVRKVR